MGSPFSKAFYSFNFCFFNLLAYKMANFSEGVFLTYFLLTLTGSSCCSSDCSFCSSASSCLSWFESSFLTLSGESLCEEDWSFFFYSISFIILLNSFLILLLLNLGYFIIALTSCSCRELILRTGLGDDRSATDTKETCLLSLKSLSY